MQLMPALTSPNHTSQSDLARDAATKDSAEVLRLLGTSPAGLTEEEAAARLEQYGPNEVGREKHEGWLQRLYIAARNPLVILLTILAILSFATGDFRAGAVMLLMVVLGVSLRFIQETRANTAAAKLKAMISVTATVVRDGQAREIPLQHLSPATWSSCPPATWSRATSGCCPPKTCSSSRRRSRANPCRSRRPTRRDLRPGRFAIERTNICFLGTSVESGSATAVIVATGAQTYFGKVARSLAGQQVETASTAASSGSLG